MRGTVIKLDRGFPLVQLEDGSELRCEHATALVKGEKVRAVIGDVVDVSLPEEHDKGIIEAIEPRTTAFVRKDPAERTTAQVLAANFDSVIIAEPIVNLNIKRLERELVLAHETGARVAIVLTKADLASSPDEAEAVQILKSAGIEYNSTVKNAPQKIEGSAFPLLTSLVATYRSLSCLWETRNPLHACALSCRKAKLPYLSARAAWASRVWSTCLQELTFKASATCVQATGKAGTRRSIG